MTFYDDVERARFATDAWVKSLSHLSPEELAAAIADNPAIAEALLGALRVARKLPDPGRS